MGIWLCRVPKLPYTSTLLWLHNSLYSHLENRKLVSSVLMSISYNCHLFQSYSIRIHSLILFAETECAKLIRKPNPLCVWNWNRKYNICTTNAMIYNTTSHLDLWKCSISTYVCLLFIFIVQFECFDDHFVTDLQLSVKHSIQFQYEQARWRVLPSNQTSTIFDARHQWWEARVKMFECWKNIDNIKSM